MLKIVESEVALILFYLGRYTIKLLLTEISVHTRNICSDTEGAAREEFVGDYSVLGIITQYQGLLLSTRD